jgi:hypothetical protein
MIQSTAAASLLKATQALTDIFIIIKVKRKKERKLVEGFIAATP